MSKKPTSGSTRETPRVTAPSPYDDDRPPSVPVRGVAQEVGGEAVALLGLPNSGKTSFLYALKNGGASHAVGQRPWKMGLIGQDFERLTGQPDSEQPATPVGVFQPAKLCRMIRPWFRFLPWGPSRWVIIPEIAGETVGKIARGEDPSSGAEQQSCELLWGYLDHCNEVIFLASIDGTAGGQGGATSTGARRSAIDASTIENAILTASNGLRRILAEMQASRHRREPIFVTFLITKRDQLKDVPALDQVVVPALDSAVFKLVTPARKAWLEPHLQAQQDGSIVFRVNAVCSAPEARGDAALQEAVTADFLRCHAPKAARDLSDLSGQPGISFRLFMCAPYGRSFMASRGQSIFPSPEKLEPAMVYECLEDVLERSFRWRTRIRLRRAGLIAALAACLVFLTGPLVLWVLEARFNTAMDEGRFLDARSTLKSIEWLPWTHVERWISSDRSAAYAAHRWELRTRWTASMSATDDGAAIVELEEQVRDADVDGPFGKLASESTLDRTGRDIAAFLSGEKVAVQDVMRLDPVSARRLAQLIRDYRRSECSGDTEKVLVERTRALSELRAWLAVGDAGTTAAPGLLVTGKDAGLVQQLADEIELAVRSANVRLALMKNAGDASTLQGLSGLVQQAVLADDLLALQVIDSRMRTVVASNAISVESHEPLPILSAELVTAPNIGLAYALQQQQAANVAATWLAGFARELAIRPNNEDLARRIAAQAELREIVEPTVSQLAALDAAGDHWMFGTDLNFRVGLERLAIRAALIAEAANGGSFDSSVEDRVRRAFAGSMLPVIALKVRPASDVAGAEIVVDMRAAFNEQQSLLASILNDGVLTMDNARDVSTIAAAKRREAARKVVAASIPIGPGEVRINNDFLIAFAEAIATKSPDAPSVRQSFGRLLSSNIVGGVPSGGVPSWVMTDIGRSAAAPRLVGPVLEELSGIEGMDGQIRRDVARSILGAMEWSKFGPEETSAAIEGAVKNGIDPLELAVGPMAEIQRHALEGPASVSAVEQEQDAGRLRAWLVAVERIAQSGKNHDLGPELMRPTLERLQQGLVEIPNDQTPWGSPAARLLDAVAGTGAGGPSPSLERIAGDIRRMQELINQWRLLPLTVDGKRIAYLGAREWTIEDVATVFKSQDPDVMKSLAALVDANFQFPYDIKGEPRSYRVNNTVQKVPVTFLDAKEGKDIRTGLRIWRQADAKQLAKAAGLRLPRAAEWNAAKAGMPPGAMQLVLENGTQGPRAKTWKTDWSSEQLELFKDKTPAGFVALGFGIREWLMDDAAPVGLSNLFDTTNNVRLAPAASTDVGIRAALDAVPESLVNALGGGAKP